MESARIHSESCSFDGPIEERHICGCNGTKHRNVFNPEPVIEVEHAEDASLEPSPDGLELTRNHISVLEGGDRIQESPKPQMSVLHRNHRTPNIHPNSTKNADLFRTNAQKPVGLIMQFQTACEEAIVACSTEDVNEASATLNMCSKKMLVIFQEFQQICKETADAMFKMSEDIKPDNAYDTNQETNTDD